MRSACCHWLARTALPLLLLPAAGCASDHDPVEKQLKKLEQEIATLQSETDRMGERMDAMEVRQASGPRRRDERDSLTEGSSTTTLSRPKLKVVRVEPGSELGYEGNDPESYPEPDNGPRVLIQGEGKSLETRTLPAPAAAKSAPGSAKAPKSDKGEGTKASKSDAGPSK